MTTTPNVGLTLYTGSDEFVSSGGFPTNPNSILGIIDRLAGAAGARISTATVASSTAETAIATLSLPAAVAAAGSVYRLNTYGTFAIGSSETIKFSTRVGGAAGTQVATFTSTAGTTAAVNFLVEAEYICVTAGAAATWLGWLRITSTVGSALIANPAGQLAIGTAPVTKDSTGALDLVITATHSVSNAGNTLSAFGGSGFKVTNAGA
jgi:hypothetical protein